MKIAHATYGHTDPADPARDRNAMLLVNWGLWCGVQLAAERMSAEAIDLSPPLGPRGIRRDLHADLSRVVPADILLFQGGVSLHVVERMREIAPDCILLEQRESTHAKSWLALMHAAMERHDIRWQTGYDNPAGMARDLREYDLAKKILVPSGFVASTFVEHGLGDKVLYYGPSLCEFWPVDLARPPFPFRVLHAAQLGLRKGTLDVFAAWRQFRAASPKRDAILAIAGLPEHGAPTELKQRLDREFRTTPDVVKLNWLTREQLRRAYADAHVVLMPSVEDGATMVGVEGAYAGCAIVSTHNAGIDLPCVDVDDVDEIADALEQLASDPTLRAGLARRAHDAARSLCGLDAYAGRVAGAIEEAVR